ncbi:MAG: hypothetical protein COX80_03635 [Candidatus Magasanikbacteria bacterium CG_4_10_14_0_2_um_filter_33_14]|uniref:Glycosyltransferase 2-like domain-containing protein n=1 Tax=Candidatus Magasanikbacteria bacterium CG_4_10_14_0_2_um_filter_33_14 TaxID=1974636 RepID=A0A2M7VA72_9BACT|nr:MAG: hypothetical protein COX80_03635 [Candidatus Magasanikbacteria bacterium CG_4_10_14_0_2_um_filter_33_14]
MTEKIQGPLFSIVIPAYNEEKTISSCLDCAKKVKIDFDYEIIVVDNNSKDKTSQIAKDAGVKVFLETKQGVGAARKKGTQEATGFFILHIDADTHLPENYLEEVLKRFEKDSDLVCVGGQMFFYDAPLWKDIMRVFLHHALWFFAVIISRKSQGPMGNNMTFRKDVYDLTSGFDETLHFGEDMDISKKMSDFGKVKLDMSLKCPVSSRRYKINKSLFDYSMNFFKMSTKGELHKNELPPANEVVKKHFPKLKDIIHKNKKRD